MPANNHEEKKERTVPRRVASEAAPDNETGLLVPPGDPPALAHGNDFETAQLRWYAPIFNRLLASASLLVTISRANAQRLRELVLPEPELILPATDSGRFIPTPPPLKTSPPLLLTVARLVSRNGIDTVLHTLPLLLELVPRLQFWIVGDGPERPRLQQLVQNLHIEHVVRFLGKEGAPVFDSDLPGIFRRASIFVLPTRQENHSGSVEGFGIVNLEAGASALPVVTARSRVASEAAPDNETGLLVPPGDPPALAQALYRLIADPALRQRMGRAGRRWVEREMNWDRAAAQFLSVVNRVGWWIAPPQSTSLLQFTIRWRVQ